MTTSEWKRVKGHKEANFFAPAGLFGTTCLWIVTSNSLPKILAGERQRARQIFREAAKKLDKSGKMCLFDNGS